jgi:thiol-disulfide isomerase/thioredoxin
MTTARRAPAGLLALSLLLGSLTLWAQPPVIEPELRLKSLQGDVLDAKEFAHGSYVLVFWSSWSPRSRDIAKRVTGLANAWREKARVVTVDFEEDRQAIETFLSVRPMAAPVFMDVDGTFARKYGIATLPGLLVLRDGTALYRGQFPDDPDRVLLSVLTEPSIPPSPSRGAPPGVVDNLASN